MLMTTATADSLYLEIVMQIKVFIMTFIMATQTTTISFFFHYEAVIMKVIMEGCHYDCHNGTFIMTAFHYDVRNDSPPL